MQYRFGRKGAIELRYPADPLEGTRKFRFAHHFRTFADMAEVSFDVGDTAYAIFDYQEGAKQRAGVRVTAGGKDAEIVCRGSVHTALPRLEAVLPCDRDNALTGGRC